MFCMLKKKKVYPAYVSKNHSNRERQVQSEAPKKNAKLSPNNGKLSL